MDLDLTGMPLKEKISLLDQICTDIKKSHADDVPLFQLRILNKIIKSLKEKRPESFEEWLKKAYKEQ